MGAHLVNPSQIGLDRLTTDANLLAIRDGIHDSIQT